MTATARLFMHGRSQAVRLPKEFRFAGTEVKVSKVGDRVILEPLARERPLPIWDAIDALGGEPFMPEGRGQSHAPADPAVTFDE
jgi:antitoxin VapB